VTSSGLIRRNWRLKIAAFAITVLLWATIRVSAVSRQDLPDVAVRVENDDPDWVPVGFPSPATVQLGLTGPARDLFRVAVDRPVIVGHSAAAVLAVRFAAEHPELVGGVVNVDAIVANKDTYGFSTEERRAWADDEMADVLARYDSPDAWQELNSRPTLPDTARARFYEDMWRTPPRENVFAYWRDWLRAENLRD